MKQDRAMKRRKRAQQSQIYTILGALAVVAFLILCMSVVQG